MKIFSKISLVLTTMLVLASSSTSQAQSYCEYLFGFAWCGPGWAIDDITIGSFSEQNSACNSGPYNNNTSTIISLQKGTSIPFSLASGGTAVQWAIWIDLNSDGDFTDATDFFWGSTSPSGSVSSTFVIPASATAVTTRIRIASRDQSIAITQASACDFGFQAETQDFQVTLSAPGGCSVPVNLAAAAGVSDAFLSWDSVGTQYNVEYGLFGFQQGNGTTLNPTTDTITISGLSANTDYDFYVQNDCSSASGDSSSWNGPFSFTTACTEIASFPSIEDFDDENTWVPNISWATTDDTISGCWERDPSASFSFRWIVREGPSTSNNTGPSSDYSGSGSYLHITDYGLAGDEASLISPTYNTTSLTTPYLTFYYHMYGLEMGNLYVDVSSNGGISWTTVDSLVGQQQFSKPAPWLARAIDISSYKSANFLYRFRGKATQSTSNIQMAIDEVTVAEAPSCPAPSSFTLSNLNGSGVSANWMGNANQYIIEVVNSGFQQGTGAIDTVTGTSYTVNNLFGDTWYDIYIMGDCGSNGISTWVGPYQFKTHITPPWFEDFDLAGFLPNTGWRKAEGVIGEPTVLTPPYSSWTEDGWLNSGFTGAAKTIIPTWGTAEEWFFTESFDLGTGTWELYFDAAVTTNGAATAGSMGADDTLKVVISTDGGQTWNNSNTIFTISQANNLSNSGQSFVVDLSGYSGVVQFGFYMESTIINTPSIDFFIDDMGIRVPAACPAPTAVNATAVTENSVTLSWTSNVTPPSFMIEYGPKGFTQGTGTFVTSINATTANVTGLLAVTEYDFYVHGICGSDTSAPGMASVLTGCPGIFQAPYNTNFDILIAGNPPVNGEWDNCWKTTNPAQYVYQWKAGKGVNQWATSGPEADHTTGIAGEGLYMFTEGTGLETSLINGPFDLSTIAAPTLSFWYHMYGQTMGDLHVELSINQVDWIGLISISGEQQTSKTDPWLQAKIALSQFKDDTVYLRFRGVKGSGNQSNMAIDDVFITNGSGCIAPSGLTATNITTTSAELLWGSYASNHTIEWGLSGFVQGTGQGTIVGNLSTSSYNLTGLSLATAYDFYVKDTCNNNVWAGPYTFYTACSAPYSGTYTVGGTGAAFASLELALESLANCGVSGPVTLSLQGIRDTMEYSFVANAISGLSAINTLTIEGNGNDSLFALPNEPFLFGLNGASYISFKNLSLFNKLGDHVIWFHNGTHHVTLENCKIYGYDGFTTNYSAAAILASSIYGSTNGSGDNANHISIIGNTIYGGHACVSFYGQNANHNHNLLVEGNTFVSPFSTGVRVVYVDSIAIRNNIMKSTGSSTFGYGAYADNLVDFEISGNDFVSAGNSIFVSNCNTGSTATTQSSITNNMIVSNSNSSALYVSNSNKVDIYHNSVNANNTAVSLNGYGTDGDYLDIRNNIFKTNTGEAFYNTTPGANNTYNYNIYDANGGDVAYDNSNYYATLAAWKTGVNSQNANSIESDPGFASNIDLHIISAVPNDVGDNTVNVTEDFDGDTRPASGSTTVDIGADEYTPKTNDVELIGIYEPLIACGDSNMTVSVVIRNLGINNVTSAPVTVVVSGDINTTISATYTGSLPQLAYDTLTVGTINTYAGATTVTLQAYANMLNDEDASNDTSIVGPVFFVPAEPSIIMPDTVCGNAADATLRAEAYDGVFYSWFANQADLTPVSTGDTFNFPLSGQTDWYLGYTSGISDSIKSANFNSLYGGFGGVMFDITAKTNLSIDSLAIHTRTNATFTDDLIVYYIPNATFADHINYPANWILLDTISYTSAGANSPTMVALPTPLGIPNGANYAIYLVYDCYWADPNPINSIINSPLMRFEGGAGFFSGAFNQISQNRLFDGIIYAHNEVCSNSRTLVSVPIYADTAIANFSTTVSQPNKVDVDASASQGDIIEWNFGDGNTANGIMATHIYTTGGPYTISCIVTDTVCGTVDTSFFNVVMTIGLDENELANAVEIYPNPSNGVFNLRFASDASDAQITVVDALGQVLTNDEIHNVTGGHSVLIDLTEKPSGLYFVQIKIGDAVAVKKITKL